MSKIIIDTNVLAEERMSITEFMRLYSLRMNKGDDNKDIVSLQTKGFVEKNNLLFDTGQFTFRKETADKLNEIMQKSVVERDFNRSLENWDYNGVWEQVSKMYPKGCKVIRGNKFPWKVSSVMFKRRMMYLFRAVEKLYTEEEVVDAFRSYTADITDYTRTMQYFIYNHDKVNNEFNSDLSTVIECGLEGIINKDWMTDLV